MYLFSLDFMTEKIEDRYNYRGMTEERMEEMDYIEEMYRDEYVASLDRFESMAFEWENFWKEPLLGYGFNKEHSWFYEEISPNFVLTGGLVKILSQFGIFIGILLYLILFYSSIKVSRTFKHGNMFAFFAVILLSSISYSIFVVPVFTAFWLYGLFCYRKDELNSNSSISVSNN